MFALGILYKYLKWIRCVVELPTHATQNTSLEKANF